MVIDSLIGPQAIKHMIDAFRFLDESCISVVNICVIAQRCPGPWFASIATATLTGQLQVDSDMQTVQPTSMILMDNQ